MDSNVANDTAKLLRAQTYIFNYVFSYMKPVSLICVVELGIADAIHNYGKPMPLSNLIDSLQIHPSKTQSMYRLMRFMVHFGFFSQHNVTDNELELEYALTDISILLLKTHPMSMVHFLHFGGVFTKTLTEICNWLKSDDDLTPFEMTCGMSYWDYAASDPKLNRSFNDGMANDSRLVSSVMMDKCKGMFMGLESLVDVGGGTGIMAKAIGKSFPHIKCIVLDLPHVVADLRGSDNLRYVGGNMFQAIPPADAILLKMILHNWNDEDCMNILKNCKEAISTKGKTGKVIVIDTVIDEEKRDDDAALEVQLFLDMVMMVRLNGKERNKKEWAKLISSAGFSDYKITPIYGFRSLIEIYP